MFILFLFCQVLAVMSYDVENISSENAGIVMYRNIRDTIRTHFGETNGAGAFLEAPLQAYYGIPDSTSNYIDTQKIILLVFMSTESGSRL